MFHIYAINIMLLQQILTHILKCLIKEAYIWILNEHSGLHKSLFCDIVLHDYIHYIE